MCQYTATIFKIGKEGQYLHLEEKTTLHQTEQRCKHLKNWQMDQSCTQHWKRRRNCHVWEEVKMEMKLLLYLGNQNKSEPFEKVQ